MKTTRSRSVATLWKNGVATHLSDPANVAKAYSVYASDNDVYVAGYEYSSERKVATLWKNGTAISLGDASNLAETNSIFVSNGDVYAVGKEHLYERFGPNNWIATLWKNGTTTRIAEMTNESEATSVFVYGNDVYVAGAEKGVATLWKNGKATSIGELGNEATANSVFVSGSDVYVAGHEKIPGTDVKVAAGSPIDKRQVATLWKNGIAIRLDIPYKNLPANPAFAGLSVINTQANSVFIFGKDVYVVGRIEDLSVGLGRSIAVLWKNGKATILGEQAYSATAHSIFVK